MSRFRLVTKVKLKEMLEERNLWSKMQSGRLLEVEQNRTRAKRAPDSTSYIISYYDEHLQYVCTIHKIVTRNGEVIHEHVKDAFVDGVRYKAE